MYYLEDVLKNRFYDLLDENLNELGIKEKVDCCLENEENEFFNFLMKDYLEEEIYAHLILKLINMCENNEFSELKKEHIEKLVNLYKRTNQNFLKELYCIFMTTVYITQALVDEFCFTEADKEYAYHIIAVQIINQIIRNAAN